MSEQVHFIVDNFLAFRRLLSLEKTLQSLNITNASDLLLLLDYLDQYEGRQTSFEFDRNSAKLQLTMLSDESKQLLQKARSIGIKEKDKHTLQKNAEKKKIRILLP